MQITKNEKIGRGQLGNKFSRSNDVYHQVQTNSSVTTSSDTSKPAECNKFYGQ